MLQIIIAAFLSLIALPAFADSWTGTTVFQNMERSVYSFVNADTAATAESGGFQITKGTVLVCFDPDSGSTTISGGEIVVRRCLGGPKPASNPTFECISTGGANSNATLTGTEGAAATQNACQSYGPGWYYIDVTTTCTSDACRVTLDHYPID